jgi:tRNA-2-methylthio-N6-dimethylallyladenosine synthase
VSAAELARQQEFTALLRELLADRYPDPAVPPKALVRTFGCQGNEADGERIRGMLCAAGYELTDTPEEASLILYNTCAVREHAEDRAFGNVGRLKSLRQGKKDLRVGLCGCMVQQPHAAQKIRDSFSFVDLVFGTHAIHRLPELLYRLLSSGRRVFDLAEEPGRIAEGLPVRRESGFRAWLPIMYGCDNFCSYCVVPLVRGRERGRRPELIIREARELMEAGYKEITLLGQNVNSYRCGDYDFPRLLRELDEIGGEYWLRFMTSHPKDCSPALLDTMATGRHIAKHLHLPVQSGSDRVLREMNRGYDAARYLDVASYARQVMPGLSMTSDVIVGFPGETYEDFRDTLALVARMEYTSLFTFLYSPREGTRAAALPDPVPRAEKVRWFQELTALQEGIAARRGAESVGRELRVLCEGRGKRQALAGRSEGSVVVEFDGPEELIEQFADVRVTKAQNWLLDGALVQDL